MSVKFVNGNIYDGNLLMGRFDGKGKLSFREEKGYYDGFWKLGKSHGNGVRIYADGSKFVGEFREGSFITTALHNISIF